MPELPDISIYVESLRERIVESSLEQIDIQTPFVLRSVDPQPAALVGLRVVCVERLGKRVVIGLQKKYWIVIHLMIAGRLRWSERTAGKRRGLAHFGFTRGWLTLTEAGSKRRASILLMNGESALATIDPGGLEPLECSVSEFSARLCAANHTLKRALTDPRIFSGIGNAYSDEILHRARLSPVRLTSKLTPVEIERLHVSVRSVLLEWTDRLRAELGGKWPEKVTAFRPQMAVHGRFGEPCPECGTDVQRIRYKSNETNYCPRCQTGGRMLADRSLSRLLKSDWPRSIDEG